MANITGPKTKETPSIADSAAKVRLSLGEAGVPIAEALLITERQIKAGVDEMRGHSSGAHGSAVDAARSAGAAEASVATMRGQYSEFLTTLERQSGEIDSKVQRAETAASEAQSSLRTIQRETSEVVSTIAGLTHGDAKGVAALQQISEAVDEIPSLVRDAVAAATSIEVPEPGKEGSSKTLSGGDAIAYLVQYLSNVSRSAGDAVGQAKVALEIATDAKTGLDALKGAIEGISAALDQKVTFLMVKLQNAGLGFSAAEVDAIEEPSYKPPAAPPEPATETDSSQGDT